jgi:hypothetical protein
MSCCEYGNELTVVIKCRVVICMIYFLKKDSVACP